MHVLFANRLQYVWKCILRVILFFLCKHLLYFTFYMFCDIRVANVGCSIQWLYFPLFNRSTLLKHHNYQVKHISIIDYLRLGTNKSIFNNYTDYFWRNSTMPTDLILNFSKEYEKGMIWFFNFHDNLIFIKRYLRNLLRNIRIIILDNDIYYTSPDISKWVYHVSSVVMAVISVFGISSNSVVIGAYFRNKKVWTQSSYWTTLCCLILLSGKCISISTFIFIYSYTMTSITCSWIW